VEAQLKLGAMYYIGLLCTPKDYTQAVKWWQKAAEQGDAAGQQLLGVAYYKGAGVPQDYVEAHKWANLAAGRATGETRETSAKQRDLVAAELTPAQIAEAQKLAREWQEQFEKRKAVQ